jgi:hypothetical protein
MKFGNFCGKCGKDKDTQKTVEELGWVRVLAKSKNKNDLDLLVAKIHVLVSQEKATLKKQIREEIENIGTTDWLRNTFGLCDDDTLNAGEVEEMLNHYHNDILSIPLLKVEEDKKE